MPGEVVLKISNVRKSFGAIQALRGVDFELRRGEIHAIAGENGAGKSTLMNIIDGILKPDSGEIEQPGKAMQPRGEVPRRMRPAPRRNRLAGKPLSADAPKPTADLSSACGHAHARIVRIGLNAFGRGAA